MSRLRLACTIVFVCGVFTSAGFIAASMLIQDAHAATQCRTVKTCHAALRWQKHDRAKLHHQLAKRYHESVDTAFRIAEVVYGMPRSKARVIGMCESNLNPLAYNSATASGVMQLLASTFRRTPYAGLPIFSPVVNILSAGWLWKHDGSSFREWSCSAITGVR